MVKYLISLLAITVFSLHSYGGKIERGYEALKIYDYFKAKKNFTKAFKKSTSPASFGLATIYYRSDNPFHSLDSAYKYILLAENNFEKIKDKKRLRYSIYGFHSDAIDSLKQLISTSFYNVVKTKKTLAAYDDFILKHNWSVELKAAIYSRDSIAFEQAKQNGKAGAYKNFLNTYPTSDFQTDALELFYKQQYLEATGEGTIEEFARFADQHKESPYLEEAQNKLYNLSTEDNTVESVYTFIHQYPDNINVDRAWNRLYQLYVTDYSSTRIEQFVVDFPEYPFIDKIHNDLKVLDVTLFPFVVNNQFGFIDTNGIAVISPSYDLVGTYNEGFAVAKSNGKFGYIDKHGSTVIPFQFDIANDFENGRALVEKNNFIGVIDRTGTYILNCEFNDVGPLSEGMFFAKKDSVYGYYNKFGQLVIDAHFEDAYNFNNGIAKVEIRGYQAFIDTLGKYVVEPAFEELEYFNDSIFIYAQNEKYGLTNRHLQILKPAIFDFIGQVKNNRAIYSKEGYFGYLDENGNEVISNEFDEYPNFISKAEFNSGKAIINYEGQYGIIDKNGKHIIKPSYEGMGAISALIAVSKKGKWGFIDQKNKLRIPFNFDFAESFVSQNAIVENQSLIGVINQNGEIIIPIAFTTIKRIRPELFVVNNGTLFGLYSGDGNMIIPIKYQQIREFDENFLILISDKTIEYYDVIKGEILKVKNGDE